MQIISGQISRKCKYFGLYPDWYLREK